MKTIDPKKTNEAIREQIALLESQRDSVSDSLRRECPSVVRTYQALIDAYRELLDAEPPKPIDVRIVRS